MSNGDDAVNPNKQERIAWLGLIVSLVACAYLATRLFQVNGLAMGPDDDAARIVPRMMAVFLVGVYLIGRRDASPLADERDREIQAKRTHAAYFALALMLTVAGATLGMDAYRSFWESRSVGWLESGLMLMLVASIAVHASVGLFLYRKDRQ